MGARQNLKTRAIRTVVVALIVSIIAGCAVNPVVTWKPPPKSGYSPTNLDYAHSYGESLRTAYKQEIHRQVGRSSTLNSGLVIAGALALALAASTAHRDALLGTALVGGTAYGLGAMNLPQQRLLILQAGIDAIDCANRAMIPLSMTNQEKDALADSLAAVPRKQAILDTNLADVRLKRAAYLKAGGAIEDLIATESANVIIAAEETAAAARTTVSSGQLLAVRAGQAGDYLVAAFNKIDGAILKATLATLPDITSVPKVIAGLAGFAASIAPGAGVDTIIAARLAARGGKENTAVSGNAKLDVPKNELRASIDSLRSAVGEMLSAKGVVDARISAYQSASSVLETLNDCGVGDISFPLKVSTEKLMFSAGEDATKTFLISGGTRPYVVELVDAPAPGVTLKGPAPFEFRAQVTLSKDVKPPQTFTVLVMDASSPTKTATVTLIVDEKPNAAKDNAGGEKPKTSAALKSASVSSLLEPSNMTMSFSFPT